MMSVMDRLSGYVRVWNEAGQSVESHNLVVFTGADIITRLLTGNQAFRIQSMYFVYENTVGVPTPLVPSRNDVQATFQALVAPKDYLRAPILEPTQLSSTAVQYQSNQATFLSVTVGTVGAHGVPFGSANNSKVTNVVLLASPTGLAAGDVVYASFALPTAIAAAGSGQISAAWNVRAL